MSLTFNVTSADDHVYEIELDDSAMVDNPAEYPVKILRITPEDSASFQYSKIPGKSFMVNISYEPDVEWGIYLDERYDDMLAAIGRAYLEEIGY